MNTRIIIFIFFITNYVLAAQGHKKHNHAAHVHGGGQLSIAFDGLEGRIEFKCAAESVLGFEYKPKKEQDIKTLNAVTEKFSNSINKFIQFDQDSRCQITSEQIGQVPEKGEKTVSKHSDWQAQYNVKCEKSIAGSKLKIDFTDFDHIKDLDITLLIGAIQKNAEYTGRAISIELK